MTDICNLPSEDQNFHVKNTPASDKCAYTNAKEITVVLDYFTIPNE